MRIARFMALGWVSLAFSNACWANGELPESAYTGKVRVCYAAQDIPEGRALGVYQIREELLTPDQVTWKDSCSKPECLGKVAPHPIATGTRLTLDKLASPTEPTGNEKWLLHYSIDSLDKLVGKKVAIKGSLMSGSHNKRTECIVVSVDDRTSVRIALPCEIETGQQDKATKNIPINSELQKAVAQRREFLANRSEAVVVSGVLHRDPSNILLGENYSEHYFLDQNTVKVTPSSWCSQSQNK